MGSARQVRDHLLGQSPRWRQLAMWFPRPFDRTNGNNEKIRRGSHFSFVPVLRSAMSHEIVAIAKELSHAHRSLLFLFAAACLTAAEERVTMTGKVVDASGKPVDHATVMVYEAGVKKGYSVFCPTCWTDCGVGSSSPTPK